MVRKKEIDREREKKNKRDRRERKREEREKRGERDKKKSVIFLLLSNKGIGIFWGDKSFKVIE